MGPISENKNKLFYQKLEMGHFESHDSVLQPYATWKRQSFSFIHGDDHYWFPVNRANHDNWQHPVDFDLTLFKVGLSLEFEGVKHKRVMTSFWEMVKNVGSLWAGMTLFVIPLMEMYNGRQY